MTTFHIVTRAFHPPLADCPARLGPLRAGGLVWQVAGFVQPEDQIMARMTGGEAIVDGLIRHGIDTMFGLPGVQTYGLFDALARNANRIRLINARHEQT